MNKFLLFLLLLITTQAFTQISVVKDGILTLAKNTKESPLKFTSAMDIPESWMNDYYKAESVEDLGNLLMQLEAYVPVKREHWKTTKGAWIKKCGMAADKPTIVNLVFVLQANLYTTFTEIGLREWKIAMERGSKVLDFPLGEIFLNAFKDNQFEQLKPFLLDARGFAELGGEHAKGKEPTTTLNVRLKRNFEKLRKAYNDQLLENRYLKYSTETMTKFSEGENKRMVLELEFKYETLLSSQSGKMTLLVVEANGKWYILEILRTTGVFDEIKP